MTQSVKLFVETILQKIPGAPCESLNPSKPSPCPNNPLLFSHSADFPLSPLQYNKHLFVHIGHANHSYSDPLLESVDIRQIYDKFPEKKGGLKELFGKGPQNAFFLVKFWVSKAWVGGTPLPRGAV